MIRRLALALPTLSPLGGGVSEAARLHLSALSPAGFEQISVHTLDTSMEKVDPAQWAAAKLYLHRFYGPKSYSFAPGLFLSLTVLSVNILGDALRDALDPKMVRRI